MVLEVIERIKDYLIAHPDLQRNKTLWIEGFGWDQTKWPVAEYPKAVCFPRCPFARVQVQV